MKTNQPRQLRVLLAIIYYPIMVFLQTGRDIVTAMTGNTNYTTPFPVLADITAALDDLQAKITAAAGRDRMAMAARNAAWAMAKSLIRQLANYVQAHCQNDVEILLTSGFTATKTPAPIGPLLAPENLKIVYLSPSGTVELRMEAVRGVRGGYPIEQAEGADGPWVPSLISSKSRALISNLTPGKSYRLRAAAIGADGQSGWSNAVGFMAI
jgi:hypothetical protein